MNIYILYLYVWWISSMAILCSYLPGNNKGFIVRNTSKKKITNSKLIVLEVGVYVRACTYTHASTLICLDHHAICRFCQQVVWQPLFVQFLSTGCLKTTLCAGLVDRSMFCMVLVENFVNASIVHLRTWQFPYIINAMVVLYCGYFDTVEIDWEKLFKKETSKGTKKISKEVQELVALPNNSADSTDVLISHPKCIISWSTA